MNYNDLPGDLQEIINDSYKSRVRVVLTEDQIKAIYLVYKDVNIHKKTFAEKMGISYNKISDVRNKINEYVNKNKLDCLVDNDLKKLKKIINKEQ